MALTLSETNPPPPPPPDSIDASLIERARRTSKVAWVDPTTEWIYVSNNDKHPTFPEGNAVLNMKEFRKVRTARRNGKLSDSELYDKSMFGMYNSKDGWQDYAVKYHDEVIKPRTAGLMNLPDYTGIEVTSVLSELLGVEERGFVLQDAIRVINSPTIETNIDTWQRPYYRGFIGNVPWSSAGSRIT